MNSDAQFRDELRRAIDAREFQLHFQPRIELKTMSLCGTEALIRWNHPERGMVMPGAFIQQAEVCGCVIELGQWVLRTAVYQATQWIKNRISISIAVNVSPIQLLDDNFVPYVETLLRENHIPTELLELEITEGTEIQHELNSVKVLHQIRDLGIQLSLDDFGTAYSSLKYLKMIHADSLKLDRYFIHRIASNPRDFVIAQFVVQLGHRLGMRVVAEGVETQEQLLALRRCGCDEVQGFYLSPPLPVECFEERFLNSTTWSRKFSLVSE